MTGAPPARPHAFPIRLRFTLAAALILTWAAPQNAFAHSAEFILAKVTARGGRVMLDLTVDCSENPMISSEAEAQAVLSRILRVRGTTAAGSDGAAQELSALAPLHFERRTQIDPDAPIPRDPTEDATKPHRLVCAMWSWNCPTEKIAFEVPPDAGQTLILWTPAEQPGQQPRWVMLVSGDVAPGISVPRPVGTVPWMVVGVSIGLVGASVPIVWWRRRSAQPTSDCIC